MKSKATVISNPCSVKLLGLVITFLMLGFFTSPTIAEGIKFTDFDNQHQEWPYAYYLIKKNVISGYPDITFRPQEPVTRAQLAIMLTKLKGIAPTATQSPSFTDVSPNHYAYDHIQALANEKVLSGYPDKTFKPDQKITRAELAAVLFRFFDLDPEEARTVNLVRKME